MKNASRCCAVPIVPYEELKPCHVLSKTHFGVSLLCMEFGNTKIKSGLAWCLCRTWKKCLLNIRSVSHRNE